MAVAEVGVQGWRDGIPTGGWSSGHAIHRGGSVSYYRGTFSGSFVKNSAQKQKRVGAGQARVPKILPPRLDLERLRMAYFAVAFRSASNFWNSGSCRNGAKSVSLLM